MLWLECICLHHHGVRAVGARLYGRRRSVAQMAHGMRPLSNQRKDERSLTNKQVPPVIDPQASLTWYVVVVSPRMEANAEKALQDRRFTTYVPQETYWARHRMRNRVIKIERQKPLIPGYLFLGFSAANTWYSLRDVDGVTGVISSNGSPCQVPVCEVKRLADLERRGWFDERRRSELSSDATHPAYQIGDQVLITGETPLKGFTGLVRSHSTAQKVEILISILGRFTPAIIPIQNVSRVDPQRIDAS
jgi:transcriptional antiterminator RfaH